MLDDDQESLLRALADATRGVSPDVREPFTVSGIEGRPRYLSISHPGLLTPLEAYRGDLVALEYGGLIRAYDLESSTSFVFDVTPLGLARPSDQRAVTAVGSSPAGPKRWGKWVAVDGTPFKTSNMSALWRVRDDTDETRTVRVLKSLKYAKGRGSAAYRRFVREITTLGTALKGRHQGIIEVLDYSVPAAGDTRDAFYVMPLARGSLKDLARDLKGELAPVLRRILPVVDALAAAHEAGVIHRDIKPDNILLFDGEPVLADFGICFLEQEDRLTRAEAHTVGTDEYVAPELLGGGQSEAVTPAADVYSLAKTIFAVVSGGDVFPREKIDDPRYDLVQRFGDPQLAHLQGLVQRMITEDPSTRPQTMAEARELLTAALENLRDGESYREGMYAGTTPALARAKHIRRLLRSPAGTARLDGVRKEILAATEAAEGIASVYDASARHSMALGRIYAPGAEAAAAAAEELLASGMPLVVEDQRDFFEMWLAATVEPLTRLDGYQHAQERQIMHPAGVLAAHGVGALAWRLWRLDIFRQVVDRYVADGSAWLYHDVLGRNSAALDSWMIGALKSSELLRTHNAELATDPTADLRMISGIAVLKYLSAADPNQLNQFIRKPSDMEFPIPFAPGLFNLDWVGRLLALGLRGGPDERDFARKAFDMTSEDLRTMCGRLTPTLISLSDNALRRLHRIPYFNLGVDSRQWERWTGVQMMAESG